MPQLNFKNGSSWVLHRDIFYPVGSIFMSIESTSPASLYGGQWSTVTNCALGHGLMYDAGEYFGSNTHTLTIKELPAHTHTVANVIYDYGWQKPTDNKAHPDNGAGVNTPFGNGTITTSSTGGGRLVFGCPKNLQRQHLGTHCLEFSGEVL